MPEPLPAHLQATFDHLKEAFQRADKAPPDLLKSPWSEVEKAVVKVLGGAFNLERPEHQAVALGLAAALGQRLSESDKAFWFPNRESPEGAMLGFPDGILMLSPFGAVMDALGQANLGLLDAVTVDVRKSLAQARFSVGGAAQRLGPEDYRRLFDAGFVQFSRVDPKKLKSLLDSRADALVRDFRDALSRTGKGLPAEAKAQFEAQVVGSLQRLDAGVPLSAQVARQGRLVELLVHLFATQSATGAAPEEFWYDVAVPLMFIGAPPQFPPLDDEELEAARAGADPLALFLDLVPYQSQAPEDGLLGLFDVSEISLPVPDLGKGPVPPRLLQLKRGRVEKLLAGFDAKKTEDALSRFTAYLTEKAGKPAALSATARQMVEAALLLLGELKRLVEEAAKDGSELVLRRITEAEASSEAALTLVRQALQGPRIIMPGL